MLLMAHRWPLVPWVACLDPAYTVCLHIFFPIGLAPLCENMPSGKANKPGDVVRAKNGKTIQVCKCETQHSPSSVPQESRGGHITTARMRAEPQNHIRGGCCL